MEYLVEPKELSFNFDLKKDIGRESRYLKFGGQREIEKYIDKGLEMGDQLVESKSIYSIVENNQRWIDKFHLPKPLHKADLLAFGVSTIGTDLEERVNELMKEGDYALSNILDSVGSAAVSETADRLGEKVLDYSRANDLQNTRSFSPGSGSSHWKIKNQQFIFDSLNPSVIGVQLTSSFTMVPKKSSSFVIGLGTEIQQAKDLFTCEGCKRTDCPYRYTPSKATV